MSALEIIQEVQKAIDAFGPGLTPEQIKLEYLVAINERLLAVPPFAALKDTWFTNGNNGGGFRYENTAYTAHWIIRRLLAGDQPETIVGNAQAQIAANALEVWEITKVTGITVSAVQQLTDDAWLYPNTELPHAQSGEHVFIDWSMFGRPIRTDTAALVHRFPVAPMYMDASNRELIEKVSKDRVDAYNVRSDFRIRLKHALVLQGTGAVEMETIYATTAEDNVLPAGMGFISTVNSSHIYINENPDISATLVFFDQLRTFTKPTALYLAIERLGRARGGSDVVNKIIDLGMALEIAVMHDDPNHKEEITAKTGLRAGWLVGTSPEERLTIKRRAAKVYGARSQAVHKGKADSKLDIKDADELVTSLLKALLARGSFPDWDALVFGG